MPIDFVQEMFRAVGIKEAMTYPQNKAQTHWPSSQILPKVSQSHFSHINVCNTPEAFVYAGDAAKYIKIVHSSGTTARTSATLFILPLNLCLDNLVFISSAQIILIFKTKLKNYHMCFANVLYLFSIRRFRIPLFYLL